MGTDLPRLIVRDRPNTMAYERPTLTAIGSFEQVTGLGCSGPRDTLFNKQCL